MNSLKSLILSTALVMIPGVSQAEKMIDLVRADIARINTEPMDCSRPGNQKHCSARHLRELRNEWTEVLRREFFTEKFKFDEDTGIPSLAIPDIPGNISVRVRSRKIELRWRYIF